MAANFLEPGGDATFNVAAKTAGGLWLSTGGTPAVATDVVHGSHIKSIQFRAANTDIVRASVVAAAGSRESFYIYLVALPTATASILKIEGYVTGIYLRITSGGVLQLWEDTANQMGSDGPTLATGQWYRISMAHTYTSVTVNRFEVFVDGTSAISVTDWDITGNLPGNLLILGNISGDSTLETRVSDIYVDLSTSLTDTGDIWVTAKRPNANGTTNDFVTQIGAGGSGYGTGHSPQVNERALSTTNGWSVVAVGATTEEYNIEDEATGDINISGAEIVDYMGWVNAKALIAETASIVVDGATSNISLTSTITTFTKVAGSTTYPAGTGTDIGIVTDATATTVSLYECGIVVAVILADTLSVTQSFQNSLRPRPFGPGLAR